MATKNAIDSGLPIEVSKGGTGSATLTDHGILVGSGTSAVTALAAATDGQLIIGSTGNDPVTASLTSSGTTLEYTAGAGSLNIDLEANYQVTAADGWNGASLQTQSVQVTSDGATITLSIERSGGGDLTIRFSDGFYEWDTTPADTVTLTAGSDTSPTLNYVYLLQSTKTLTASTTGFPATEHLPIATVLCQSAASLQTYGAYKVHAWTDHVVDSDGEGHIYDLNKWIRNQNATWLSGVAQTLTITPNVGVPDNVIFTTSSGEVLQLHQHAFPAFAGTPDIYVVNDSVTPYNRVTDLNSLLTDSAGVSMSGRYFSLVIWGVVSEDSSDCKLFCNLPSGSYLTQTGVEQDVNKYANYTFPSAFKGTAFLISELKLQHQIASGGTWTSIDEIDLRGAFPSTTAGGATSAVTMFPDNTFSIFDDGDSTKQLAFQCSGITSATTRTITMDDRNIDMDAVPDSIVTDAGTVTPAAGSFTIAGGTNVTTSGSGSTVTINATGGGTANFYNVPTTTALNVGTYQINSVQFVHAYGTNNSFFGSGAGNFTMTATENVAVGTNSMDAMNNGNSNVAVGYEALGASSGGIGNVAIGRDALTASTTGGYNIAIGYKALDASTTLSSNIAIGKNALGATTSSGTGYNLVIGNDSGIAGANLDRNTVVGHNSLTRVVAGDDNVAVGSDTLRSNTDSLGNVAIGSGAMGNNTGGIANYNVSVGMQTLFAVDTGSDNTCIGTFSGNDITTGNDNTAIGKDSLSVITTGSDNIAVGNTAASSLTTSDSDNIIIGNTGSAGLNNEIIIGTQGTGTGQQNKCTIAGIYGATVGGTNAAVLVDNTGVLGTTTSSIRFKDNVVDMPEKDASKLHDLRVVNFTYKKDIEKTKQFGLIAEEVVKVLPEIVNLDQAGLPYNVRYHDLVPMLLREIQILSKRISKLEEGK